jgi:chromosome segregation protein
VGDVGLATLSELEALQERTEFLRRQKGDLERSLEDLEKTIHRLDHVSRDRFRRAFTRIAEVFHEMIPRLFAGAEAELALVEGEEGVGGGVEIFVRLPGKKLESVSLLSGGEKALVSIAFLFAIFEANPGPFCILDEVDAPLDDANVARFSELVRAIAARAQVLVVTHNKKTMLAADRLYGVTMQTPGISTVLSVSLS